jgi:hypothetical protein
MHLISLALRSRITDAQRRNNCFELCPRTNGLATTGQNNFLRVVDQTHVVSAGIVYES